MLSLTPRGTTEDMLVIGHGLSRDMQAMPVRAGLATVVTETLRPTGETVKIERMHITDAGKRALEG